VLASRTRTASSGPWQRRRSAAFLAAGHFLAAAPAGSLGKDGPGVGTAWQAAASAAGARPENQAGMRNGRRFRIPALRSAPFPGTGLLRLPGVRLGS